MNLHNKLFLALQADTSVRVPFNTLYTGERYRHALEGSIHQVYAKPMDGEYMVIRRADGWLVRVDKGGFCWDKGVIKVT